MRFSRWQMLAGLVVLLALTSVGCGPGPVVGTTIVESDGDDVAVALAHDGVNLALLGTSHDAGSEQMTARPGSSWLLVKMSPEGRELWRRRYREGDSSVAGDLVFGPDRGIYVTGSSLIEGREMCVVVRYRPDGVIAWQRALAIGDACAGRGILVDDERVYISGWVETAGRRELLVVVLAREDGRTIEARNWRLGDGAEGTGLAKDEREGFDRLVLIGSVVNEGRKDILLAALSLDGDTLWTRYYDSGGDDRPGAVATDRYGHVVGVGTALITDGPRCVILEYQPDGRLIRHRSYGEEVNAEGNAVSITSQGDVFVAGTGVAGDKCSMLAFQYLPEATWIWERNWRDKSDVTGVDVVVVGDVFVLGTIDRARGGRMVLVRFSRPSMN